VAEQHEHPTAGDHVLADAATRPIIVTLPDGQQTCVSRWAEDGTPHVMWRASRHHAWQPSRQVTCRVDIRDAPAATYEEREQ
jgi:hypothetical protein